MQTEVKQIFAAQKGPHADGSVQWNVVHAATEERIGSFAEESDATELSISLNAACAAASKKPGAVLT